MRWLWGLVVDVVIALVVATFYALVLGGAMLILVPLFAAANLHLGSGDGEDAGRPGVLVGMVVAPVVFLLVLAQTIHRRRLNRRGIKTPGQRYEEWERMIHGKPERRWWDWLSLIDGRAYG